MRQSVLAVLALVAASPGVVRAQTVREIVARHLEARGRYERVKAIQTIKIPPTVATPLSNVKVVVYKKRPQLFRAEQSVAGQPPAPRGINADAAWDTAQGKVALRPADAAAEAREIDG